MDVASKIIQLLAKHLRQLADLLATWPVDREDRATPEPRVKDPPNEPPPNKPGGNND